MSSFVHQLTTNSILWGCSLVSLAIFNYIWFPKQDIRSHKNGDSQLAESLQRWSPRLLADVVLANRMVSYLHCLLVFSGSLYLKYYQNPALVDHIIMCSASYFLMDIFYILSLEYDTSFLLHHFSCLVLWSTSLVFNTGKDLAIGGLFLAEATGLLWIPWEASSKLKWYRLRSELSVPFMLLYTVIRGGYFPYYLISCIPKIIQLGLAPPVNICLITAVVLIAVGGLVWTPKVIKKCIKYRLNAE